MREYVFNFLVDFLSVSEAQDWSLWVALVILAALATLCYQVWSRLFVPIVNIITSRTSTKWDDVMLSPRVLRAVGQLIPALIVNYYLPGIFSTTEDSTIYQVADKATNVYIVWAVWFLLMRLIKSLYAKLVEDGRVAEHSSKGLLQMANIILACMAVIIAVSVMIGRSPGAIIATLGASTAILMLVFKDTILGLVAGVQLSANKMLKKGDWIVVDKAGANGEVEDVSLTTVKVRNWDESITTVPPYVLISESFQNYANMREGGGRRVMRSIYINIDSVRNLTEKELASLSAGGFISGELPREGSAGSVNLRLFRHYLERMLKENVNVRGDMRLMVRQLQPTANGLPLELFFFVRQTAWEAFEAVQSDIFDEVYAVVNRFSLSLYQHPAGSDIRALDVR